MDVKAIIAALEGLRAGLETYISTADAYLNEPATNYDDPAAQRMQDLLTAATDMTRRVRLLKWMLE